MCYNISDMFRRQVKCRDCGFLGALRINRSVEFFQQGRENIDPGVETGKRELTCTRHIWNYPDFKDKPIDSFLEFLNSKHKCPYFFRYSPGYSPDEHRELQREAKNHKLLLIGMLSAAAIGAVAALVGQLIAR